ncbi:hypothetical protein DPMN_042779 [Dreissena polymorpha]|uniref:Uncharacterized protein n=1 Tax=Dreissena polymorpha TaxID=45954 RepID=A0A9D4CZ81_DREPO|nr:hypothetical protein DPMN_042779 [Dreissena polymorpha]
MARQRPTRIPTPHICYIKRQLWVVARPMLVGPCDRVVIREIQYKFEDNCGLCGLGAPGLIMGPCIVEIDRIVIRKVQYQLEVNRCRNEEVIVKGNFGWVWPMFAGPWGWLMWTWMVKIDRVVIRDGHYVKKNAGRPRVVEIDRIVIRDVQYQFEVNRCRNEEVNVK